MTDCRISVVTEKERFLVREVPSKPVGGKVKASDGEVPGFLLHPALLQTAGVLCFLFDVSFMYKKSKQFDPTKTAQFLGVPSQTRAGYMNEAPLPAYYNLGVATTFTTHLQYTETEG